MASEATIRENRYLKILQYSIKYTIFTRICSETVRKNKLTLVLSFHNEKMCSVIFASLELNVSRSQLRLMEIYVARFIASYQSEQT